MCIGVQYLIISFILGAFTTGVIIPTLKDKFSRETVHWVWWSKIYVQCSGCNKIVHVDVADRLDKCPNCKKKLSNTVSGFLFKELKNK